MDTKNLSKDERKKAKRKSRKETTPKAKLTASKRERKTSRCKKTKRR